MTIYIDHKPGKKFSIAKIIQENLLFYTCYKILYAQEKLHMQLLNKSTSLEKNFNWKIFQGKLALLYKGFYANRYILVYIQEKLIDYSLYTKLSGKVFHWLEDAIWEDLFSLYHN